MNPRDRHSPIPPATARLRCPVCHETVYSRAGIHPQCAVRLSDPPKPRPKPKDVGAAGPDPVIEPPAVGSLLPVVPPPAATGTPIVHP